MRRAARGKQPFTERNQRTTAAAGEETEVPDADEATREYMQQEATQEFVHVQSQESLFVFVSGVSPAEGDLVVQEGSEPAVGNRNAMGVSAEIAKHLIGSAERRFAVDHPAGRVKLTDQNPKQFGLSQAAKQAVKLELSRSVSLLERFEKLAAEDFAENPFRKKEAIIWRAHPMGVIARQTAGSHDTVDVGMMLELLIPGVEDAEEADLGAEMLGVRGNFDQGLSAAAEQQPVDHFFVLQGERGQLVGEREDDVSIGRGEQFGTSRGQPSIARLALTLRAVPIPAGIVGDGAMAAA